jgi:hypothetical protein
MEHLKPLWDADCLLYNIGFAANSYWKAIHLEKGVELDVEEFPPPFDVVADMVDNRIANTHAIIGTTQKPIMYFTGKGNFRNEISTTGYKLRVGGKPFHYYNIKAYLQGMYECVVQDGLEADDLLGIAATANPDNTIIITIDKDLLQIPGWHYMWEYGKVASFGPHKVEGYGNLWFDDKKKLRGYGMKFFLAQCILGDGVDSIVGIPKSGPVAAFKLLGDTNTYEEGIEAVRGAYNAFYGDDGDTKLVENGRLLYMTRSLHVDGSPILWEINV